jgi:3-dehydroquinate synthase
MRQEAIITPYEVRDRIALPAEGARVVARARRSHAYPVYVTSSTEEAMGRLLELLGDAAVGVITDETVESLYGGPLVSALREDGRDVHVKALPPGEASKSVHRAVELWDWLAEGPLGRRDMIVCFGGGVICDLGGWVASAYMRGVPYVNVPTTLLAQVDGALGGKVAANHPSAKNLIGSFHQPAGVVTDVGYLRSVDDRHLRAGLAESIKKAVIASPEYWRFIRSRCQDLLARAPAALERLVAGASAIKTQLIERDPYEDDLRRPLNFGHTIGHPLETVTGYGPLLHGEAVAFGMVVEATIAAERGLMAQQLLDDLVGLLRRCGLPTTGSELPVAVSADRVLAAMEKVRLIRAGSLRFVLPVKPGHSVIADDVGDAEVRAALGCAGLPETLE